MRLLNLITAFILLNVLHGVDLLFLNPLIDKRLPDFVCKITQDIIKSNNHTQDVLIGNVSRIIRTSTINNIVKCLKDISPVVISDFQEPVIEKSLRKAAVIILEFDQVNLVSYD